MFHDPSTTPHDAHATPHDPPAQNLGVVTHPTPRIDAYVQE